MVTFSWASTSKPVVTLYSKYLFVHISSGVHRTNQEASTYINNLEVDGWLDTKINIGLKLWVSCSNNLKNVVTSLKQRVAVSDMKTLQ